MIRVIWMKVLVLLQDESTCYKVLCDDDGYDRRPGIGVE